MKKKNIVLPFGLKNQFLSRLLASKGGIFLSNWTFQGMRYMNYGEKIHRVAIEAGIFLVIFFSSSFIWNKGLRCFFSLCVAHTLSFFLNGHFFVLMRYLGDYKKSKQDAMAYVVKLQNSMDNKQFLLGAILCGSLSRGDNTETSDLDIRLVKREGWYNAIRAFNFCTVTRIQAFFSAMAVDVYVFDIEELKTKIRSDEKPVVLYDPNNVLTKFYINQGGVRTLAEYSYLSQKGMRKQSDPDNYIF